MWHQNYVGSVGTFVIWINVDTSQSEEELSGSSLPAPDKKVSLSACRPTISHSWLNTFAEAQRKKRSRDNRLKTYFYVLFHAFFFTFSRRKSSLLRYFCTSWVKQTSWWRHLMFLWFKSSLSCFSCSAERCNSVWLWSSRTVQWTTTLHLWMSEFHILGELLL